MLMCPGKIVFIVTYLLKVENGTFIRKSAVPERLLLFLLGKEIKRLKIWACILVRPFTL